MGERKRRDGVGQPRTRGKNRGRTARPSHPREARGSARLRDSQTSSNKDSDAFTFSALACPGHLVHFGGGKYTPHKVTPIQHAVPLVCVEWDTPYYRTLRQGGGAKEKAVIGGRIEGELGEGLSGLWITFGKCDRVQVYGKGNDGG